MGKTVSLAGQVGTSALGGAIVLGLTTSPETVTANAAKWWGVVSGHTPAWPVAIDNWLLAPAAILALTPLWLWVWRQRERFAFAKFGFSIPFLPEYDKYWTMVDDLTLWQAAYLWCDKAPSNTQEALPSDVGAQLHRLKRAVEKGDLHIVKPEHKVGRSLLFHLANHWINTSAQAVATREALTAYTLSRKERPAFLFPR